MSLVLINNPLYVLVFHWNHPVRRKCDMKIIFAKHHPVASSSEVTNKLSDEGRGTLSVYWEESAWTQG